MDIILNNVLTKIPAEVLTIADFVKWNGIKPQGSAIAINVKVIKRKDWPVAGLNHLDRVTVISFAFGG